MIINVRGTSGSGKSTLVRSIMKEWQTKGKVKVEGRKQPAGYLLYHGQPGTLYVPGHYETECGGCDTISKDLENPDAPKGGAMDYIYEQIRKAADQDYNVLFEGLLISAEVRRMVELHEAGYNTTVVHLHIPLQECLDSVNARRQRKSPGKGPVNPKNTESKWKGATRAVVRFKEAGVPTFTGNRHECLTRVKQLLCMRGHEGFQKI